MSDTFRAKYEFDVDRHQGWRETHTVICAEGAMGRDGEGSVRFWIEKRHPERTDWDAPDGPQHLPAFTETFPGRTLRSIEVVSIGQNRPRKYTSKDAPWLLRELILTVARGDVGQESAASILWTLLAQTAVKQRDQWLQDHASEWFRLVDPKGDHMKALRT